MYKYVHGTIDQINFFLVEISNKYFPYKVHLFLKATNLFLLEHHLNFQHELMYLQRKYNQLYHIFLKSFA